MHTESEIKKERERERQIDRDTKRDTKKRKTKREKQIEIGKRETDIEREREMTNYTEKVREQ